MEQSKEILYEIQEISPVIAAIGNRNIYSVPYGYFEGLANEILSAVIESQMPRVADVYSVPAGYFEGLAGSILQKIKTQPQEVSNEIFDELQEVAPLLNTISKKNIYSLPGNYFQDLSVDFTIIKPAAKVVSMNIGRRKWFRYAAAACILAILGTGIFYLVTDNNKSTQVAINVKGIEKVNVEQSILGLSDEEIKNYLNAQPATIDILPASGSSDGDFQQLLDNTPDDEIQEYLDENKIPGDKNI